MQERLRAGMTVHVGVGHARNVTISVPCQIYGFLARLYVVRAAQLLTFEQLYLPRMRAFGARWCGGTHRCSTLSTRLQLNKQPVYLAARAILRFY